MAAFLLPGVPFTVLSMFYIMRLWRKGRLKYNIVEGSLSIFFKTAIAFSVVIYISIILFVVLMWGTLGWWGLLIGFQTYLILALLGFVFTGKI